MVKRNNIHITKRSDNNWQSKKAGASRATSIHRTKEAAVNAGRKIAKKQDNGQLIVHKSDGKIEIEYTYGNDPYPPKK